MIERNLRLYLFVSDRYHLHQLSFCPIDCVYMSPVLARMRTFDSLSSKLGILRSHSGICLKVMRGDSGSAKLSFVQFSPIRPNMCWWCSIQHEHACVSSTTAVPVTTRIQCSICLAEVPFCRLIFTVRDSL